MSSSVRLQPCCIQAVLLFKLGGMTTTPNTALRAVRELSGLTQAQVAEDAGVSKSTVSRAEAGHGSRRTTVAICRAIALALSSDVAK